jgi:hypothetical protein
MFSPSIAEQLRLRGHDVVAVKERPELQQRTDAEVFAAAQLEGRAVVTENVRDYRELAYFEGSSAAPHAGVIYTTERAFFRGSKGAIGRLVEALDVVLNSEQATEGLEVWLRPA